MIDTIECKGLWQRLQEAPKSNYPLTGEELKKALHDIFTAPRQPHRMMLPTYCLLAISDKEFICMMTMDATEFNKHYYFMGGSEANRLVQERKAKLLPNG